jgi:uncharacterized membrane protein YgdD (TMEM256/DUF423 family)
MTSTAWIAIAAVSGALAVVAGAFGAHGLPETVAASGREAWRTAATYHLLHSVALLALALHAARSDASIGLPAALFLGGIVLFSGSIYGLVLTQASWLGPVTPLGGLLLIAGWAALLLLARG